MSNPEIDNYVPSEEDKLRDQLSRANSQIATLRDGLEGLKQKNGIGYGVLPEKIDEILTLSTSSAYIPISALDEVEETIGLALGYENETTRLMEQDNPNYKPSKSVQDNITRLKSALSTIQKLKGKTE